jgi:hypothetical protein
MTVVEDFLLHGGYVKNVVEQLYSIRMVCESLVSIPEDSVIPTTHDGGGVVPCKGVIMVGSPLKMTHQDLQELQDNNTNDNTPTTQPSQDVDNNLVNRLKTSCALEPTPEVDEKNEKSENEQPADKPLDTDAVEDKSTTTAETTPAVVASPPPPSTNSTTEACADAAAAADCTCGQPPKKERKASKISMSYAKLKKRKQKIRKNIDKKNRLLLSKIEDSETLPPQQGSWLLRLFESKLFDMPIAISYLFNSKESGVLAYLGNKLFSFQDQEVDIYLPELM